MVQWKCHTSLWSTSASDRGFPSWPSGWMARAPTRRHISFWRLTVSPRFDTPDTTSPANRCDAHSRSVAIETKLCAVVGGRLLVVWLITAVLVWCLLPSRSWLQPKGVGRLHTAEPIGRFPGQTYTNRVPANLNSTQTNSVSIQTHLSVTECSRAHRTPTQP